MMSIQAEFHIAQSATYAGRDRWTWSCWIDAAPAHLDEIASVTWILHPTFAPSRRTVTTRANGFRLDSGGWGTFTLRARLTMVDGATRELRRALKLSYPATDDAPDVAEDSTPSNAGSGPKVFLSYAAGCENIAQAVNQYMADSGASVLLANDASPDQPVTAALEKMIRESDAFISITAEGYASHWAMLENKIAHAEGLPILSVPASDSADMQAQVTQFVKGIAY